MPDAMLMTLVPDNFFWARPLSTPLMIAVFAAVVLWAIYTLVLRRRPTELSSSAFLAATFAIGILCILPFYLSEFAAGAGVFGVAGGIAQLQAGVGPFAAHPGPTRINTAAGHHFFVRVFQISSWEPDRTSALITIRHQTL